MEKEKPTEEEIICLSCFQEVKVILVELSNGHVAVCPICDKLAYNGK